MTSTFFAAGAWCDLREAKGSFGLMFGRIGPDFFARRSFSCRRAVNAMPLNPDAVCPRNFLLLSNGFMVSEARCSQSRDEDEFVGIKEGPGELLPTLSLYERNGFTEFVGFRGSIEA